MRAMQEMECGRMRDALHFIIVDVVSYQTDD